MVRKVFDNRQVAHVWASRSQDEGRSNNGQFYFTGPTIYSYGSHFPLASFFTGANGRDCVMVNMSHYGVTTSKHQGMVRSAIPSYVHKVYVRPVPSNRLNDVIRRLTSEDRLTDAWLQLKPFYLEAVTEAKAAADNARRGKSQEKRQAELASIIREADAWCEALGVPVGQFSDDAIAEHLEAVKREQERQAAERAEREAAFKAECELYRPQAEQLAEAWRNGQDMSTATLMEMIPDWRIRVYWQDTALPTLVRREGEEAITSRGARVPWAAAVKLYRAAANVKAVGKDYAPEQDAIRPRIGHFELIKIEANGNATVGCHYLTFEEMHKCAVREGVALAEEVAA